MKKLVAIAVVALALAACGGSTDTTATKKTPATTAVAHMTLGKFDAITNGMTYEQVVAIVGSPGRQTLHTEANAANFTADNFEWPGSGDPRASASVQFQNDLVIGKTEIGLR